MSIFSFLKSKTNEVTLAIKAKVSDVTGQRIFPASGFIKEINDYSGALNSFTYDNFTDAQIELILANPFVKAKFKLLLSNALSYNSAFNYDGVKKQVSKYLESNLMKDFKWRELARQILYSRYYGKAVIRVYWNEDGTIDKTVGLNHNLFTYNNDYSKGDLGDLMYNMVNLTKSYPYNFITIFNEADAKHPFGKSDLKELYPTIMFYNFLSKVEARYFNKAVIPSFVAGYDTDKTGDEAIAESEMVGNILSQIENGAGVGIGNLKQLYTLLENGQVNFNSTIERLANTISIAILGSDMTDSKKNGTYAQANAAVKYIDGNVKDLATDILDIKNEIIEWQTWSIFGTDYKAPYEIYDMQEPIGQDKFEFQAKYGFAIDKKEASKVYAIPQSVLDLPGDTWIPTMKLLQKEESKPDEEKETEDEPESDNSEDAE